MELQLVYRVLRKFSDWTLAGYFSEVYISGTEGVPKDGPLIITPTHHNEIIDIAVAAATIPYRRHVSFWAKSTMFVNPITRAIMVSSGSIPVKRNPNKTSPSAAPNAANASGSRTSGGKSYSATSNEELFRDSFIALSKGQVLGVFPEGTSYTEPSMTQLLSGAAWAAVEFEKWRRRQAQDPTKGQRDDDDLGLKIVPVAIVYTDKAKYRSRVVVRYGKPILLTAYADQLFNCSPDSIEEATRTVVKDVMAEVERQLLASTINAPDWDTIYAARMARDMLWSTSETPLKSFVEISQLLVDALSTPQGSPNTELLEAREALVKYRSLLHYTKLSHGTITDIYSLDNSSIPTPPVATVIMLKQLLKCLFHPRFIFFFPAFIVHRAAYICAALAARFLTNKDEEEAQAQYKTVFGGFGSGVAYAFVTWRLSAWLQRLPRQSLQDTKGVWAWLPGLYESLKKFGGWFEPNHDGFSGRRIIAFLALFYGTSWILVHWHNFLIDGNYKQFKRFLASFRLLCGAMSGSTPLPKEQLQQYSKLQPPPPNPFIKRRLVAAQYASDSGVQASGVPSEQLPSAARHSPKAKGVPSRMLIRPLLSSRAQAIHALRCLLENMQESQKEVLLSNGASIHL